jgi:RNA polymerase sigma-70 factor (ECF subfamily)
MLGNPEDAEFVATIALESVYRREEVSSAPSLALLVAEEAQRVAIGLLFFRHSDEMEDRARRIVRDPVAAEDVLQDAFFNLLRRASTISLTSDARHFALETVANAARDLLRKEHGATSPIPASESLSSSGYHLDDVLPDLDELSPEDQAMLAEQQRFVRSAVQDLPLSERQAIQLHFFDGLSVREVSGILDRPYESTKKLLQRAYAHLRPQLATAATVSPQQPKGDHR